MIDTILTAAITANASDVHLTAGHRPTFRVWGDVAPAKLPATSADDVASIARGLMGDGRWPAFQARRDVDFSVQRPDGRRLRVNAHYQRGTVAVAIRLIYPEVRPLEELFLPAIVDELTKLPRGLVLVTGGTGSGKSTTLAGMVEAINRREAGHIVTLEDPIEYPLVGDRCCVEQREVGDDVPDFASGLRHVLRQDPDVILVGEMRDLETARAALTAAETGHLVLSTLHTTTAAGTVDRIVDLYPAAEQAGVRGMLASSLSAVVSQQLLRRADRPGMIPAVEVLVCTPAVRHCIREGRTFEIPTLIETGRAAGMQTMDASVRALAANGYVRADRRAAA